MRVAFVANLDAECELERPDSYRRSPRMRAALAARGAVVQRQLADCLEASVELLVPGLPPGGPFAAGLCWCPTPNALRLLEAAGAPLPDAPPLHVLQRVNHRAFGAALQPRLAGARFVRSLDELDDLLAGPRPPLGHFLKRPFGFAGRARKHVPPDVALVGALRTWAAASMSAYGCGLQVEPRVPIEREFAQHGVIDRSGKLTLGEPTCQEVDGDGAWLASVRATAGELDRCEREALRACATRVAHALIAHGYVGPFGVDAFRYRDGSGSPSFHPLSEINARLTMGFAAGMARSARTLLAVTPAGCRPPS